MKSDLTTAAFYAPITKVDKTPEGHRIVTGTLQSESVDIDGQIADYDWFKSQATPWFEKYANVREMHDKKAAGKGLNIQFDDASRSVTFVSKAVARDTIEKLDEGLLTGYSFGVKNDPNNPVRIIKDAGAPKGRIVGGAIIEASYVDRPANEDCVITIAKMAGADLEFTDVIEKAADESSAEEVVAEEAPAAAEAVEAQSDDAEKAAEPDLTKDGGVPVLEGDEAAHNAPLNDALTAIKTLINQELAEDETEFDCVNWLSGIAQSLLAWAASEQDEDGDDDGGLYLAAFGDLIKAAAEPDIAKRRVFYSREHRTAVEQALRNLSATLAGDMQGPAGVDPTTDDAPGTEGAEDGTVAEIADQDDLHADGDARVSEPESVEQAGPTKGAESDIDKAVEADLEKYATPDFVKAAIESALEELRPKLEEALLEKFASAETMAEVRETVEKLAGGPHPTGPRVGQVVEKVAAINETVEDSGPPLEVIQKMAELEKAVATTTNAETRTAYEGMLRQLRERYLTTTA